MATDRDLAIRLRAYTDEFRTGMTAAAAQVKTFATEATTSLTTVTTASERMTAAFSGLMGALVGGAIIDVLYNMAKAASTADTQFGVMAATAKNMHEVFDAKEARAFTDTLATTGMSGGASLNQLRQGFQALNLVIGQTAGGQAAAQRALQDVISTTVISGKDFDTVLNAIVKAAQGTYTGISRLGIGIDAAKAKAEGFTGIMAELEKKGLGATEKASVSLLVQQAALAAKIQIMSEELGERLIPVFSKAVDEVNKLIEAWAHLSPQMQDLIERVGIFIAVSTSMGLIFNAIIPLFGAAGAILKTFGGFLWAAVTGAMRLTEWVGLLTTAEDSETAATVMALAPWEAIVAILVSVVAIIVLVIKYHTELANEIGRVTSFASNAWGEMTHNMLHNSEALRLLFSGLAKELAGQFAAGASDIAAAFAVGMPKTMQTFYTTISDTFDSVMKKARDAWAYVKALFAGQIAAPLIEQKPPGSGDFSNQPPTDAGKKAAAEAAKAAKEAVQAAVDATNAALDQFALRVENGKTAFDKARADLEAFKATLPEGKPRTEAEARHEQELINKEIEAEKAARELVASQIDAQLRQQKELTALAAAVPKSLTNHLELARQLTLEARKHGDEAQRLYVTYTDMRGTLATLALEAAAPLNAVEDAADKLKTHLDEIAAKSALVQAQFAVRDHEIAERAAGKLTPVESAQNAADLAQAKVVFEQTIKTIAEAALAAAQAHGTAADVTSAQEHLAQVTQDLAGAQLDLKDADLSLKIAATEASQSLATVSASVAERLAKLVPGLEMFYNSVTGQTKLTMNWATVLGDAIVHTQAYADIQRVIASIMQVVARALDALRPVIDLLLRALIGVVNVFIFLWNVIARILNLFGLQIPILQTLNDSFAGITPLIQIFHDIPTLNELSGRVPMSPLYSKDQQTSMGIANPLQSALNTHTSLLTGIGTALVAGLVLWALSNVLHLFHIGETAMATALQTGANVAIITLLGTMVGILAAILVKPSFAGFTLCPGVDQPMETREHGFIRAGDLKPGMHLRADDGCEWHELYKVEIKPTNLVRSINDVEPLEVNFNHCFKDKHGAWVAARLLEPGDELLKANYYGGGTVKIVGTEFPGRGFYAALDCEHHEYIIGHTIGHNDSQNVISVEVFSQFIVAAIKDLGVAVKSATRASSVIASAGGAAASGFSAATKAPVPTAGIVGAGSINLTTNHFGDIAGIDDVAALGTGIADAVARYARLNSWELSRAPTN